MSPAGGATHEVDNQPPPLQDYNLFDSDPALGEATAREGAAWAAADLSALGKEAGTTQVLRAGALANEHPPVLRTHDRFGNRIDEVEFHPSWHRLMEVSVSHGVHAMPWRDPRPGAHVARAGMMILGAQVEAGHGCPISMTYAAIPALRREPSLAAEWEPRLTSVTYDPRLVPAGEKAGALAGMAMTEKQGGSDVRANTTRAEPLSRWWLCADRAQVVLLGPDVRRLPRACPGAGGPDLLAPATRPPGRHAQRVPHPAAEGQARQQIERVERDRVQRRVGRQDR